MIQICVKCGEEMTTCPKCNDFKPSIQLISELSKASREYGKLHSQFELLHNFVRKIIKDWECDPNHAESILAELQRMKE